MSEIGVLAEKEAAFCCSGKTRCGSCNALLVTLMTCALLGVPFFNTSTLMSNCVP